MALPMQACRVVIVPLLSSEVEVAEPSMAHVASDVLFRSPGVQHVDS